MKRLLLILLLTVLPLQMSWAAVTGYCQHETGKAAQHLGHHEHKHQAQASGESQPSKSKLGAIDADCGYCHLFCATIVATHQAELISIINSTATVEFQLHPYRSHIPDGPARPDWRRVT